jgi:PilZ domain-containing protein
MRRDRRKNLRVDWHSTATIYVGKLARHCILSNFSNGGAKIAGVRAVTIPDEFSLQITPHGRIHGCRVVWRTDDALGVQFTDSPASTPAPRTSRRMREPTG